MENLPNLKQTRDDTLVLILPQEGMRSEHLSELAQQRDSFGIAWICLALLRKKKTLGKVSLTQLRKIDLSGTSGLSVKKLFYLLDWLPLSIEDITFDSLAVTGEGLPRFLSWLERLQEQQNEREVPQVKAMAFADDSIGASGSSEVLPALLVLQSLQSLCLKGNPLGIEGIRVLAGLIKEGKGGTLKTLDLERTGLTR
uniref:Uncharacterized protein n=1 Tax=Chromera velia CCMP2878 TaxID=1169474 RepID=A0A0G4IA88_9ALVE|eukprot:Cvel_2071.t1-p1 / transcript=Cvel_2071.t1 / gene=Cvel_2071 / organism=Chromera_velia_CCMP2878 / gene_product=hypothetical protein / transcript_product=hypothetical protein / location=Cvel_scaffold80:21716-24626(+) / protein_length=197 / sequence_SO=supercontig / SO=protein_coding / is_pseudo=false